MKEMSPCKVVCTGTGGFGHVLCWFSAGVASPCVCGSIFIEIIGRHYWHEGAKMLNTL